jgi:hypothetical protein
MRTKYFFRTFSCMAVSLALLSVHAQVDGFNKGKGNMDLVASLSYEQGLNYFLADGTANIKRNRIALSLFAARGLTDDLDVQLSIPFISTTGTSQFSGCSALLKMVTCKGGRW